MGERTQCRFCCRYPDEVDGTNCMWCSGYRAGRASTSTAYREQLRALVEAAKRVIDLYDEDQMDSLGFAARRMTAMTALRAALAEVDRG